MIHDDYCVEVPPPLKGQVSIERSVAIHELSQNEAIVSVEYHKNGCDINGESIEMAYFDVPIQTNQSREMSRDFSNHVTNVEIDESDEMAAANERTCAVWCKSCCASLCMCPISVCVIG